MGIGIQILSWENKTENPLGGMAGAGKKAERETCLLVKERKKRYTEIDPAEPEKSEKYGAIP